MKRASSSGDHADPAVRMRQLEILAGSSLAEAGSLLARGLGDPAAEVAARAGELLAFRHPWLTLDAFKTGALAPAAHRHHRFGAVWFRLRAALAQLARDLPAGVPLPGERFAAIPGLLPDWMQALSEAGRGAEAADVGRLLGDERPQDRLARQILLAPTYGCNLDCSYCYVKEWARSFPGHMTPAAFRAVLDWCGKQGVDWLIFGGGEPTVHPEFGALAEEAEKRGMKISLTSNGLFGESVRKHLRPSVMAEFICHVEQDVLLRDPRRADRLRRNIAAAQTAGVAVRIRYTLTSRSDRAERRAILELARAHGIRTVNYGFAFRNIDGTNEYFAHDRNLRAAFDALFNDFMDEARAAGTGLHLSKPFPLCHVTPRTLQRVAREGGLNTACTAWRRGYSLNLTVNPDLTTLPCNALRIPGPRLLEFEDFAAAGRYHAEVLRRLFARPWQPKCARCLLHHRGICQGACLAEHDSTSTRAGG